MYVQPVGIATVESFLTGLRIGFAYAGFEYDQEVYKTAAASRGWQWRATGIAWQMREKQLSEESIVQELIAIEVEAYTRAGQAAANLALQQTLATLFLLLSSLVRGQVR